MSVTIGRHSTPKNTARQVRVRRRRVSAVDGPDPIDVHVGMRIRYRRNVLRMSQSDLAGRVGLTFQQIQKYERGSNRVSASVLYRTAEALKVPVSFFFAGLEGVVENPMEPQLEEALVRVARMYAAVPKPLQLALTHLIERIARMIRKPDQ